MPFVHRSTTLLVVVYVCFSNINSYYVNGFSICRTLKMQPSRHHQDGVAPCFGLAVRSIRHTSETSSIVGSTAAYRLIDTSLASSQPKKRRRKKLDDESNNSNVNPKGSTETTSTNTFIESDTKTTVTAKDIIIVEQSSNKEEEEEDDEEEEEPTFPIDSKTPVFKFDREEALAFGIEDAADDEDIPEQFQLLPNQKGGAIELPSMKEIITRKQKASSSSSASAIQQEEEETNKTLLKKIKRNNIETFNKLLEVEPNADTDLSFFEDEKFGVVSALLGEGAKTFLGIPMAILQTGHFMGTLALLLMAFVEYPGFPLTDLPSSIREALQTGLLTIYGTNAVLAIFAAFKAQERGQPMSLWVIKTFGVGGLAYDQLTQLPTMDAQRMAKVTKKGSKRLR